MGEMKSRRSISTEPMINFVHGRLETILAVATALFIVYTTCLPTLEGNPSDTLRLSTSQQDLIQNVFLYLPLGFFIALTCRRRRANWTTIGLIVLIISASLSCSAEFAQQFFPGRVPSLQDVLANATGALIGGLSALFFRIGTFSFRQNLSNRLRHQPIFISFLLACGIYAFMSLVPFQLNLTPTTESTVLNPARLTAYTPARAALVLPDDTNNRARYDHALDLGGAFVSFVILGFMASYSFNREFEFSKMASGFVVLWITLLMSLSLAIIQMFIQHVGFHIVLVPVSLAGAMIGILASWSDRFRVTRSLGHLSPWVWPALLICTTIIVARELNPFEFDFGTSAANAKLAAMSWIPFKQYFTTHSVVIPSSDMLAKFGRFFVFGIILSYASRNNGKRALMTRIRVGSWTTFIIACGIEAIQLGCPQRFLDITHILLAMAGSMSGIIILQWWLDVLNSKRPQLNARSGAMPATLSPTAVIH